MFIRSKLLLKKMSNQAVQSFDIFGQSPNIRVLENEKYTSAIGCVATFFIGTATIIYMASEFFNLYTKSQPSIVTNEVQIFDSTSFPLYNENFTLAITIADKNSKPILGQDKYYNITVNHCIRERIINESNSNVTVHLNCYKLPTAPCTRDDFTTELQSQFFKNTRLGVVQCIDREKLKTNPPVLQGIISGNIFQYLQISVTTCRNNTNYQGCAPQEEIKSILTSGYYAVYASDYLIQLDRGSVTYQEFINMDVYGFSITTSKMLTSTYRIQEVHSDDGLLFSTDDVTLNLRKEDRLEQTELYNGDYLVQHTFQLDYKETIYKRAYIKVQVILSKIGGIWQLFIFLCSAFLNPFIKNFMTISIANQLYRFPNTQKVQTVDLKQSDSIIELQQVKPKENQEKLSTGLIQSLFIICGCNSKQKKLFHQARSEILQRIDVVKILQKLQEIEMLKFLLLDDGQQKLFDLIPQPAIREEKNAPEIPNEIESLQESQFRVSFRLRNNRQPDQNEMRSYFNSFYQVSQCKNRNDVDNKLLNIIDKSICKYFEEVQYSQQRNSNICSLDPLFKSRMDQSIIEPSIQRPR